MMGHVCVLAMTSGGRDCPPAWAVRWPIAIPHLGWDLPKNHDKGWDNIRNRPSTQGRFGWRFGWAVGEGRSAAGSGQQSFSPGTCAGRMPRNREVVSHKPFNSHGYNRENGVHQGSQCPPPRGLSFGWGFRYPAFLEHLLSCNRTYVCPRHPSLPSRRHSCPGPGRLLNPAPRVLAGAKCLMKRFLRILQPLIVVCVVAASVWMLRRELTGEHGTGTKTNVVQPDGTVVEVERQQSTWELLKEGTHDITGSDVAWAVGLTVLNYVIMFGYDWLAIRYLRHPLPAKKVMLASFVGNAASLNFGSLLGGTSVRFRFYALWKFTPLEILQLIVILGLTFWLGVCLLAGIVFLIPWRIPPFQR